MGTNKSSASQTSAVLKFMRNHGAITSKIAFDEFGVTRLASIVGKLRARGFGIVTTMEYTKTRYGTTSGYARYTLTHDPEGEKDGKQEVC